MSEGIHMTRSRLAALALLAMSCGDSGGGASCLALPCPLPFAVIITVTSSVASAQVSGVTMHSQGPMTGDGPCNGGTCYVPGGAGSYVVDISAPGFTTAHVSVSVTGTAAKCGCGSVDTAHLSVSLVPAP
jgi:hypothetical protein